MVKKCGDIRLTTSVNEPLKSALEPKLNRARLLQLTHCIFFGIEYSLQM